jgi:hypothetical protein
VLVDRTDAVDAVEGFERVLDVVCTLELDIEDAEAALELMVVQGRTLTAWL